MSNSIIELDLRKFVAPEYIFGVNARHLAGNYCRQLGGKRVLLVTDEGICNTPWLVETKVLLEEQGLEYHVFSSVSSNPRDVEVMNGAEVYRSENCNIILALGGGSVIDCAKGIGIVSTNSKSIAEFEGVDKISRPMPPLVCIPTTAGTSADVSQFAIINRFSERYKMAIISKATVPDVSLIDPAVLVTMNPFLTACTAMDALSHAFEAYVSNASSAFTDLYALESIKHIHTNLKECLDKPNDVQLRARLMLASLYAGLAFSNASLGCVHSLAHSLGGYLDLPHGECNAILLPHVVDFNYSYSPDKYRLIAENLGILVHGVDEESAKEKLVDYLINFRQSVGIKSKLGEKGVTADILSILSSKAINDPCNITNPRIPNQDDLSAIYSEAL